MIVNQYKLLKYYNEHDYGREYQETQKLNPESIAYALSGLLEFTQVIFRCQGKEYNIQPHHIKIAHKLERVLIGKTNRLIINIPPRHGKTQLIESFVQYYYGLFPSSNTILVSYAKDLSVDSSTRIRNIINSDFYQQLFPNVKTASDTNAKDRFNIVDENSPTNTGNFFSTGAGGAITGRGAGTTNPGFGGCIVIDDPLKASDSRSETVRGNINKWFGETLISRRNKPETPIILIQQRLHEDDMTGYLLEKYNKRKEWDVLCLPAIDDNGNALWESTMPLEELNDLAISEPSVFQTQYMQNPVPDDGLMFKREKFQYHGGKAITDEQFNTMKTYIATDFAVTDSDNADATVFSVFAIDNDKNAYLIDMYYGRTTPDVWAKELVELVKRHNPYEVLVESGTIWNGAESIVQTEMNQQNAFTQITKITRTKDKVTSARTFEGLLNNQKIYLPRDYEHNDIIMREMLSFPNGRHDDIVDTYALLGMHWQYIVDNQIAESIDIDFNNRDSDPVW